MKHNNQMNLILKAVSIGQIGVVRSLIEEGHDVNEATQLGQCPILEAASRNDTKMVQLLLEHGADPKVADRRGNSPLSWAEKYKNPEMGKMIEDTIGCSKSNSI